MHRVTKLLMVLVVVLAVAVVVDKTVGWRQIAGGGNYLSDADQQRLDGLQNEFRKEREIFLHKRATGASKAELDAQAAKVTKLVNEIIKLGGVEAIQSVGRAPELRHAGQAGRMGSRQGRSGSFARRRGGLARGAAPGPGTPPPGGPGAKPTSRGAPGNP